MLKTKEPKGITLISLVITIIILLILATVAISLAVDSNGLFSKAGDAANKWNSSVADEETTLFELANKLGVSPHNWIRTEDTFTCSHCGATYTMGDIVNYTAKGKTSTIMTAEMSGMDRYNRIFGGYPNDDNIDENGNQLIEVQDASWEVLGIEDTDQDGIFETLLITTQGPVQPADGSDLEFCGIPAYTNSSAEINRICKELYSNSVYGEARGMTVTDVNNALKHTSIVGMYFRNGIYYTTENLTTKIKDLPIFNEIVANGTYTPDGKNTAEALGDYVLNGYDYHLADDGLTITDRAENTDDKVITEIERDTIFGNPTNYYRYQLASCSITIMGYDACFGPDYLWNGEVQAYSDFFYSGDGSEWETYDEYYRPVVSLKNKLPDKI